MEEHEVIEKRTVRREEPIDDKVTNVNVAPDGTTNVQESGGDVVEEHVVEEHVVEEHEHHPH